MATLITACCFCRKVRDGLADRNENESWVSLRNYCAKYHVEESHLMLSHTYCPRCLEHYRKLLFSTTTDDDHSR